MKSRYFLTDVKRLWKSYEIYAAILGVAAALAFSVEDFGLKNGNVLFTYFYATQMSGFKITFVFCTFAFAASICEDLEYKYVRFQTIRGGLKSYVASRVSVIYLSSVLTMVLGSLLFVLLCRIQGPWENEFDNGVFGVYAQLAERGHYVWYCTFCALQLGLLASMLSVLSAFFSLFITNRVLVLILPVLIYEILEELSGTGFQYDTIRVFHSYYQPFDQPWQCLLLLFAISAGTAAVLAVGIYRKLSARM